ncbi:MAG TPA: hydroxyacid dehydrogenase [Nitrososphaerales archaeon]|nr:hydroxyacid dehydrogenase [Nitrososphaerales archaeon]
MKPGDTVALLNTYSQRTYDRITGTLQSAGLKVITGKSFWLFSSPTTDVVPEDELAELLKRADAAFCSGGRRRLNLTRRVLESTGRLRGVTTASIGADNIDIPAATEAGILVANSPVPGNYNNVVQHAVALALALVKRFSYYSDFVRKGEPNWELFALPDALPIYLDSSKTLGVVGFGRIGSRVAKVFREFDMRVLAYDPYVSDERAELLGVKMVDSLDELLRESDIVSIHTFLSEGTTHLIGRRELGLMKKDAFIVNTSRGNIIDEAALIEALRTHAIAGAGLDVTEVEPVEPDNPLLKMPNVIVTPHIAGASEALFTQGTDYAVENIIRMLRGDAPKSLLNPEALPKWREKFALRQGS